MHLRNLPCILSFVLPMFALAAPASAATRYVYVVNDAPATMESFSLAPAGSEAWRRIEVGDRSLAPGSAGMIAIRTGGNDDCLYDFKLVFRDGRALLHRDFDVCKYASYHPGAYLRRGR